MPLTVAFKETVADRITRDPKFARALLREGIEALLFEEFEVGKDILRDYINSTIGFGTLADAVDIPVKSLMRMLSPSGNPHADNLFAIIAALQHHAGVSFHVTSENRAKHRNRADLKKVKTKKTQTALHYPQASEKRYASFAESGMRFRR
jgi:DNA-binding phage protein